jgi:hypothetical protein
VADQMGCLRGPLPGRTGSPNKRKSVTTTEVAALFWTKNRAALDGELLQRNGDNANAKE